MNKTLFKAIALAVSSPFLTSIAIAQISNRTSEVAEFLSGTMVSTVVRENEPTVTVEMTTCPIAVEGKDNAIYLYQEQGIIPNLNQPYRQRILELTASEANEELVLSRSFKPDNLEAFINYCDRKGRTVLAQDLGEEVCTVTLQPYFNVYLGRTPSEGCPSELRGAVKVSNRIILHPDGMDTWDRGYNEEGEKVWGAEDKPYRFVKE